MTIVTVIPNAIEPEVWERHEVDDVLEFLVRRFPTWPTSARIYHRQVAQNCDVTPVDEASVAFLGGMAGPFHVVVYPAGTLLMVGIAVGIALLGVGASLLLTPSTPNATARNAQLQSPNNELAERKNSPRLNGRIPDIFGTVRSTPDLISLPFRYFQNHGEVEYSCMCIGRGAYEVSDVRDGATLVSEILGASVEVYGPNSSPATGAPQLRVGDPITVPLSTVRRFDSVNGQVLRPPNAASFVGRQNVQFVAPNEIRLSPPHEGEDFTAKFYAGDVLDVSGAIYGPMTSVSVAVDGRGYVFFPGGVPPDRYSVGQPIQLRSALVTWMAMVNEVMTAQTADLSGDYVVEALSAEWVKLVNPATLNDQWAVLPMTWSELGDPTYQVVGPQNIYVSDGPISINLDGAYSVLSVAEHSILVEDPVAVNAGWSRVIADGATSADMSPRMSVDGARWTDPFTIDMASTSRVICNFVAQAGLYRDDGANQSACNVEVEIEIRPLDGQGSLGVAGYHRATVEGSADLQTLRAVTLSQALPFTGKCQVRARRVTEADLSFQGTVVDEIKWRDLYAAAPVNLEHFGNVTTVYAVTYATTGAITVKERKLNMLATRAIHRRGIAPLGADGFSTALLPCDRADDILVALCRDPRIGNRSLGEMDLDSIYGAVAEAENHFGHERAVQFGYTFDKETLSAEESVASVAAAVFCVPYRSGNVLKLSFEKSTNDSTLLFNHRNKIPGSETRTVRFGYLDDCDGVEFDYVDPADDAVVTYHLPVDGDGEPLALNAKKIESVGVRSKLQAHLHAWRAWNRVRFQSVATEFEATQEADLLVRADRILVADNTRPSTQDGQVVSQQGLVLELSQPYAFAVGKSYTAFLQLSDGTVDAIPVTAGTSDRRVVMGRAPRLELSLDADNFAQATYTLVADDDPREQAFLVSAKDPRGPMTSTVTAVNYDERYYGNDLDYVAGIIDADGERVLS